MKKILIIHGPNLNLLGEREPEIYGRLTFQELNLKLEALATELKVEIRIFQSNHEGLLIDRIQEERKWAEAILINPAGLTHTSVALRDTLLAVALPFVEVHLSDIKMRESFRQFSYFSDIAKKTFMGAGPESYFEALRFLGK